MVQVPCSSIKAARTLSEDFGCLVAFLIKVGLKGFSISTFNPNPSRNSILPSNPVITIFASASRQSSFGVNPGRAAHDWDEVSPYHDIEKVRISATNVVFPVYKNLRFEDQIETFPFYFH